MLGGAALGAVAGLAIYSANVALSGNEWNMGEAMSAVGVGAVGGFLIGTGVGAAAGAASFAAIGAGAGVIGGQAGYSLTIGAEYNSGNMVLSAAVSGVAGAVTGGTVSSGAVTGSNAVLLGGVVNGTANAAGYASTTLNSGGKLSLGIAGAQFALGFGIGAVGGAATSSAATNASKWMNASQSPYIDPTACTRAAMPHLFTHSTTQFWRSVLENAVQSYSSKYIPY